MGRLALQPRFVEVEHLPNGGFELFDPVALTPVGWTLTGGANGVASLETNLQFEGSQAGALIKNASGAIFWSIAPKKPLTPGMYYRVRAALRRGVIGTTGIGNRPDARLRNTTRNTSLNTSAVFAAGALPFTTAPGTAWRVSTRWFQIPLTYSEADSWIAELGVFGALSGGADTWYDSYSLIGPYVRPINMVGLAPLTYAAAARKEIVALLVGPTGLEIDITRRLKLDGIGKITEGAEEEILRLTHGDMTLTLDDRDGMLRGLFDDATPTDTWQLVLLTETGRVHGLKWDRLFAGVLDLPWSVSFDPRDQQTTLQVFSYTKALDNLSAAGIGRDVTGRTFSIALASKNATTNSTTDLMRGDVITARAGATEESFVVDRIDSATTFRVRDAARNSFSGADLTLDTYFFREKTAAFLAAAVCDEAGVFNRTISLTTDLTTIPVAQPIAAHGLGIVTAPVSLVQQTGKIVATFLAADETKRKETTGPTASWADGATSNLAQGDWRPYLTSEPGTILAAGARDETGVAWDHTGAIFWTNQHQNTGGPAFLNSIHLLRNGVDQGAWGGGAADPDDVELVGMDWDPVNGRVWGSTSNTLGLRFIRYFVFGVGFTVFDSTRSGQLRCCRPINRLVFVDDTSGVMRFYNLTGLALDREIVPPAGEINLWTLRAWNTHLAYFLTRADGTYIAIHDSTSYALLGVYRVSSAKVTGGPNAGFLTVFTLPDGRNVGVGYAGGEWFVLSPRLDGVVAYADFTGLSCASALKELAVASLAYFDADRYNVISLIQRPVASTVAPSQSIDVPLDRTSRPIWEFYRTACKVSGRDSQGQDFEVIQGADGGSARTLEVSSPLITTPGMGFAVASFYAAYLRRAVRQEDIRIDEIDEMVRVLDVVTFDDRKWLVSEVLSDPREREQTLRLFEVR